MLLHIFSNYRAYLQLLLTSTCDASCTSITLKQAMDASLQMEAVSMEMLGRSCSCGKKRGIQSHAYIQKRGELTVVMRLLIWLTMVSCPWIDWLIGWCVYVEYVFFGSSNLVVGVHCRSCWICCPMNDVYYLLFMEINEPSGRVLFCALLLSLKARRLIGYKSCWLVSDSLSGKLFLSWDVVHLSVGFML